MTYCAFYSNGLSVSNPNLSVISQYSDIVYVVNIEYSANGYPKFTIVNSTGSVTPLIVGGFELRDVGYVGFNSVTKKYPVTLTICETRLNNVFQESLDVKFNDVSIFPQSILPFLRLLDEHGSYKSYKQSLEVENLQYTIKALTKQLEEYRNVKGSNE